MPRGRLKLEPMTNVSARNQTFKKRKNGFLKKIHELATLCGVKACAVIGSCDNSEPEFWPSREEAREVYSEFKKVEEIERFTRMYNQESYAEERVHKAQEKLMKVNAENREFEMKEVMFDLLKGKPMMPHHYNDPGFIEELNLFIDDYINRLTHRVGFLEAYVESVPPNVTITNASGPVVGDVNPVVVETEGSVSNPTEVYDHMSQYAGMGVNHQEPFQYQPPGNLYDQTQPWFNGWGQGMDMNHQEPFQYQPPGNLYDQTQPWFYGSSQDMYSGLNHDEGQSSNQYPNSNQFFTSLLMGQSNQQMSDVQDLASVASMENDNNRYHQLPITSQMPLATTATATPTADLSDHSINNKHWPTRFGLD
ncbi:hypothetical protein N665_0326s0001 [Sinapis alba]|nr:hypothetical protein N665_0326s0001 [Sinapis alba]